MKMKGRIFVKKIFAKYKWLLIALLNKMYSEDCDRFNPMEVDMFDEDDSEGTDIALDELGLIEGQKFSLHYDFGDDWMFAIRVMKIEEVKRYRKPKLLSAKGSVEQYPEGEWEE